MLQDSFHTHCPYDVPYYCVYSAMDSAPHTHTDFYEFLFCTNGSFRNTNHNEKTILPTNSLLFFVPGESHALEVNEPNSAHYAFLVRKEYFEEYLKKYCAQHGIQMNITDIPPIVEKELSGFQMTYLSRLASTVAYVTTTEYCSIATHFLDSLLFAILIDLPSSDHLNTESYAVDLRRRLDNYHSLDQEVNELCSTYPFSTYTLSNHFKKLTGYTIVEYRNIKRMEYAAHLLSNEKLSVAAAANSVNISNLSYFAKQFKKQFGMTPKQYQLLNSKNKKN